MLLPMPLPALRQLLLSMYVMTVAISGQGAPSPPCYARHMLPSRPRQHSSGLGGIHQCVHLQGILCQGVLLSTVCLFARVLHAQPFAHLLGKYLSIRKLVEVTMILPI